MHLCIWMARHISGSAAPLLASFVEQFLSRCGGPHFQAFFEASSHRSLGQSGDRTRISMNTSDLGHGWGEAWLQLPTSASQAVLGQVRQSCCFVCILSLPFEKLGYPGRPVGCLRISGHAAWAFRVSAELVLKHCENKNQPLIGTSDICVTSERTKITAFNTCWWSLILASYAQVAFCGPIASACWCWSLVCYLCGHLSNNGINNYQQTLFCSSCSRSMQILTYSIRGYPWRMDWGGHDPATPVAEMHPGRKGFEFHSVWYW